MLHSPPLRVVVLLVRFVHAKPAQIIVVLVRFGPVELKIGTSWAAGCEPIVSKIFHCDPDVPVQCL